MDEDDDVSESIDTSDGVPGLSPEMQRKLKEAREAYNQWQQQGDKAHEEEEKKRLEEERVKQEKAMAALALKAANGDAKKAAKQAKFIPSAKFDGKKELKSVLKSMNGKPKKSNIKIFGLQSWYP